MFLHAEQWLYVFEKRFHYVQSYGVAIKVTVLGSTSLIRGQFSLMAVVELHAYRLTILTYI